MISCYLCLLERAKKEERGGEWGAGIGLEMSAIRFEIPANARISTSNA